MNKFSTLFIFLTGAAIGSIVTWKLLKDKYEQIAQDEIDSVKEVFNRESKNDKSEGSKERTQEKPDILEYASILHGNEYTKYSDSENEITEHEEGDSMLEPYVISPDEFGEHEDYDTISLSYYADNVLTDDDNEIIENVDDIVGTESLNHFGEYEDDSVFVRNDRLKCDYEILLDQRKFSNIRQDISHPMED